MLCKCACTSVKTHVRRFDPGSTLCAPRAPFLSHRRPAAIKQHSPVTMQSLAGQHRSAQIRDGPRRRVAPQRQLPPCASLLHLHTSWHGSTQAAHHPTCQHQQQRRAESRRSAPHVRRVRAHATGTSSAPVHSQATQPARLAVFVSGGGSNMKAIHAAILDGRINARIQVGFAALRLSLQSSPPCGHSTAVSKVVGVFLRLLRRSW